MKVLSIQNKHYTGLHVAKNNKITSSQKQSVSDFGTGALLDNTYGRSLIKTSKINFTGDIKRNNGEFKNLERKLSMALNFVDDDDVIIVGKDIDEAKTAFANVLEMYPEVISKIIFVPDDNIRGNFAVAKNSKGNFYLQNLSESPMYQISPNKTLRMNKTSSMQTGAGISFAFEPNGDSFVIKANENMTAEELANSGIQIHDFGAYEQGLIYDINKKNLGKIGTKSTNLQKTKKVSFSDVGGLGEVIKELKESVIFPIKYPEAFKTVNHGVILEGKPGTGKSLIAEAVANETNVHFIKLNGLELESKWIGESGANWRALFDEAKRKQPCVIFIDEFDAVARKREGSSNSRHDDKVVNQILTLMSDIEKENSRVFVLAATNKKDMLDDAIVRSGRFGKTINVPLPDELGCRQILDIHTRDKKLDKDFSKEEYAKRLHSAGVTGADIAAIVEEARACAYKRENIFSKMEDGTFSLNDIKNVIFTKEDFNTALKEYSKGNKGPLGFVCPSA